MEDRLCSRLLRFTIGADGISSFLHLKSWGLNCRGCPLAVSYGDPRTQVHVVNFFECAEICLTREIGVFRQKNSIFFCGEMGRSTITKILSPMPFWGPHITQSKFWPWPLTIFRSWGKTFWVWGPQGPWGRRVGVCPKLKMVSDRGLPWTE